MDAELTRPSYRELTRFFLPLVVISFSQTFTYPLVASVISSGPLGGLEYEAYAIGNQVVNFLSSFALCAWALAGYDHLWGMTAIGLATAAASAMCAAAARPRRE